MYVTRVREKEDFVIVITLHERYEKIYENYYHSPHTQFQLFFFYYHEELRVKCGR